MADFTTFTRVKLALSALWVLVAMLIAGNSGSYGEKVGLPSFISSTIGISFPVLLYWLGFWIFKGPYLRRPFEWIGRSISRFVGSESWPDRKIAGPLVRSGGAWKVGLALVAYFALPITLSWLQAPGFSNLFYASLGQAVGTLLLPMIVAVAVARKYPSNMASYAAILISAVAFLMSNRDRIQEVADLYTLRAEIANSESKDPAEVLASSNTSMGVMAQAYLENVQEIQTIIAALDDDERLGGVFEPETLRDQDKLSELLVLAQGKLEFSASAAGRIDRVYDDALLLLEQKELPVSDGQKREFLGGVRTSQGEVRRLIHEYVGAYRTAFDALTQLIAILIDNAGQYTVSDTSFVTFSSQDAVDAYNEQFSKFNEATVAIQFAQENLDRHQQEQLEKLKGL